MAITAPANFKCNKTQAARGETLHFTWTKGTGEIDWYLIWADIPGDKVTNDYFPAGSASGDVTIPASGENAPNIGDTIRFRIASIRGEQGTHEEYKGSDEVIKISVVAATVTPTPPSAPSVITIGDAIQGEPIGISWSMVSDASSYILQRSVNSGTFVDIYAGPTFLSYIDTADNQDWASVQYRVKAVVDGISSEWTTSEAKIVQSSIILPDGGRLVQLENRNAKPVFPITVLDGVFRRSDKKPLSEILSDAGAIQGPAGPGVPSGGAAGQVLAKRTGTDHDTQWIDLPDNAVPGPKGEDGKDGKDGEKGDTGPQGPVGPAGPGVPAGGTTGQVLTKKSGTNYDTQWSTLITCGTSDLTAGSSTLAAGTLYGVYEV